jgi:hypothetical protein
LRGVQLLDWYTDWLSDRIVIIDTTLHTLKEILKLLLVKVKEQEDDLLDFDCHNLIGYINIDIGVNQIVEHCDDVLIASAQPVDMVPVSSSSDDLQVDVETVQLIAKPQKSNGCCTII